MAGIRFGLAAALAACLAAVPFHGAAQASAAPPYSPPPEQDISGVWWTAIYDPAIQPVEGALMFTEEGQARYEANKAALAADPLFDESRRVCVPDGVPRILGNPYPFQIVQTGDAVTILYELNRVVRRILLDVPLPGEDRLAIFPYYSGHSVGHWEDDTLIVETAGFNDKTFIDATGLPHSTAMRTTERIRKLDPATLEIVVTVEDPVTFAAPFSARYIYDFQPGLRLQDYVCGEGHRDISHIGGTTPPN